MAFPALFQTILQGLSKFGTSFAKGVGSSQGLPTTLEKVTSLAKIKNPVTGKLATMVQSQKPSLLQKAGFLLGEKAGAAKPEPLIPPEMPHLDTQTSIQGGQRRRPSNVERMLGTVIPRRR